MSRGYFQATLERCVTHLFNYKKTTSCEVAVLFLYTLVRFLDSHPVDFGDALNLDGEDFRAVLVVELGGQAIHHRFRFRDDNTRTGVDHAGDRVVVVDGSATEVVRSLVGDDVGEHKPLAPRQARIFGGEVAIGASFLDGGDIVIVDAHSASEGGILEDFGLALADLERAHGAEGSELSLEAHKLMDAHGKVNRGEGRSVDGGGGERVVHAL